MDSIDEVDSLASQNGLAEVSPIEGAWTELTVEELDNRVESQRQTILSVVESESLVSDQPFGSEAQDKLQEARLAYAEGDFKAAAKLAAEAVASVANSQAAIAMVALAKEQQK